MFVGLQSERKFKDFVYCVGVSNYAIVGKGVGFCDVRILVCFDCVGTNRYCHWRLEQDC